MATNFDQIRTLDIFRQGFAKPIYSGPAPKPKKPPEIIACKRCMNWHRKGKHIVPKAEG